MSAQRVSSGRQFRSNVGCLVIACACFTAAWASTPRVDGGAPSCPDFPLGLVFKDTCNIALPPAELDIDIPTGNLVVSNLTVTGVTASTHPAECTAPSGGDRVCPPDPQEAGDNGYTITLDNTKIPEDLTSYFVDLEYYWGTTMTPTAWHTSPMPVGFRTDGTDIIGCANFNICPIYCTTVTVRFTEEDENGNSGETEKVITCPGGDLFTYAKVTMPTAESFEIVKLISKALCRGGGCSNENAAKMKARLKFKLSQTISGIERGDKCTGDEGPFTANNISFQPDRTPEGDCMEENEECIRPSEDDECPSGAVAVGGSTPPIRAFNLLAARASSFQNTAAGAPGQFTIVDLGICSSNDPDCFPQNVIPTVSEWGVIVLTLLVLTAGTIVFGRHDRKAAVG